MNTFTPSPFSSMTDMVAQATQHAATVGAQQGAAQLEAQKLQKQQNTANIISSVAGVLSAGLGLLKKPQSQTFVVPQQQAAPEPTGPNYMLIGGVVLTGVVAVGALIYVVTKD